MTDINTFAPYRYGSQHSFSCAEKNCTYIVENPGSKCVRQFKVDGGVFPENSPQIRIIDPISILEVGSFLCLFGV